MMTIVLVTGGARSGKSSYVLKEASLLSGSRAFIATAEARDEEMRARIRRHQRDRGDVWTTIEEPLRIAPVLRDNAGQFSVMVLDCLTLWLSNVMLDGQEPDGNDQAVNDAVEDLVDTLRGIKEDDRQSTSDDQRLFIVSNEVGMGIVPDNPLARQFRDFAGTLNQRVAEIADAVYLVTAGIPLKMK